jgi:hypothetical protein
MDIADAQAHLALSYVATVSDNGHRLTQREFRDYMANPQRRQTRSGGVLASVLLTNQFAELAKIYGGTTTTETLLAYLCRVHWLVVDSDHVLITGLGRAVLRSLERQAVDDETPVGVVLNDALSYARVIGIIAAAGPSALAEPYFELEQLGAIVSQTQVERVLTHPDRGSGQGRVAALAAGLAALTPGRPFEIRCSDAMHDRFLIPESGEVRQIGTSLNHVGKRFSVSVELHDDWLAEAIRKAFEEAWIAATPVKLPELPPAPAKTAKPRARKTRQRTGAAAKRGSGKKQPAAGARKKQSNKQDDGNS